MIHRKKIDKDTSHKKNKKRMRLSSYTQEELEEKPWLLDAWMSFIEKAIPDEGFAEAHFTGSLRPYEIERRSYILYHPAVHLEEVQAIAFTVKYERIETDGDSIVYLMLIAVDPESHRGGHGSKLMKYILSMNPSSEVWVKIHRENETSKSFFKKHGFVKTTKKAMHPRLNPSYRLPYDPFVKRIEEA